MFPAGVLAALHCSIVGSITSLMSFSIVTDPSLDIIELPPSFWRSETLGSCAASCAGLDSRCYSFLYRPEKRLCRLGSGTQPGKTNRTTSSELLFLTSACDSTRNYLLESKDNEAMCFWLSMKSVNYDDAEQTCKERGLHLISLKTVKRVNVFKQLFGRYFKDSTVWIGLDDLKNESQFRWVDDNSLLTKQHRNLMFNSGEPNNHDGVEDCIIHIGDRFNDIDCQFFNPVLCGVPMAPQTPGS